MHEKDIHTGIGYELGFLGHCRDLASVTFLKLEFSCYEYLACICPGEGMCSVSVVSFDVEHDLIDQFLL